MSSSKSRVFVTGANGQLAKAYSNTIFPSDNLSYLRQNYNVHMLGKDLFDVTNIDQLKSYIRNYGEPEVIINCAAMTNVDSAERNFSIANEINAFSIKKILSHFKGLFIQISTDYVFDGKVGGYLSTDELNPINKYGISKALGEKIVQDCSKDWVIIRAGGLFSKSSSSNFHSWIVNSLEKNQIINVVDDQICNPVSTFDLATYIIDIQNDYSMRNKIYHIGSNENISKYDFAIKIAKVWGLNYQNINPVSTLELQKINSGYVAERPKNSSLNVSLEGDRSCNLEKSIDFLKNH